MRNTGLIGLFTIGMVLAVTGAAAQQAAAPRDVGGRLERSDSRDSSNRRFDSHSVQLTAGQRYTISVRSDAFDPILEVRQPGVAEPLVQNDDADGLNPRVGFTAPTTGTYQVRVIGFAEDAAGAYVLRTQALAPLPAPRRAQPDATETVTARIYNGALTPNSAEVDGKAIADHLIRLEGGRQVMIGVTAANNGFDTVVQLFRADEREGDPLASDDDGGGDLNSLLVFRPDATGDYVVRVTSFQPNAAGAYRLRILQ